MRWAVESEGENLGCQGGCPENRDLTAEWEEDTGRGRRSRQGGLRHMAESELQPARRAWKHTGRKTRLEKTQSGPHHDGLECLAEELNLYAEGSWETWKFLSRELRT